MDTIIRHTDKRFKHFDRQYNQSKDPKINLLKKRFGKLQVIDWLGSWQQNHYWQCKCDCGQIIETSTGCLRTGNTTSCGCKSRKHNKRHTLIYGIWSNMKRRCFKPTDKSYKNYGGRGITVCERWLSFENFYADMGDPPEGMTLDRIDVNGNYCPENCRWATYKEQNNNRRDNRKLIFEGKEKTLAQIADEQEIDYCLLQHRLNRGLTLEEAIEKEAVNGKLLTYNGETMTMMDWSRKLGATKTNVVSKRLRKGWSVERAITTPLRRW